MRNDPEVICPWGAATAEDLERAKALNPECHCSITPGGFLAIVTPAAVAAMSYQGIPLKFEPFEAPNA